MTCRPCGFEAIGIHSLVVTGYSRFSSYSGCLHEPFDTNLGRMVLQA